MLQSAGGGGYGDPQKRDRGALARDIAEGYVSAAAAACEYGRSGIRRVENALNGFVERSIELSVRLLSRQPFD